MTSPTASVRSEKLLSSLFLLAVAASIATLVLISVGSFVRVTGSGLACPQWPLCDGDLIPPFQYHVLIEYSHRFLAVVVGLLVSALFILSLLATLLRRSGQHLFLPASTAFILLIVQIILGYITVENDLPPEIVTLHLATAEAIFAILLIAAVWATNAGRSSVSNGISPDDIKRLLRWSLIATVVTYVVILSGSSVVGSTATISCGGGFGGWPLCNGSLIPSGAQESIHVGHRIFVILGALVTFQAARLGWRLRPHSRSIARIALISAHLLAIQIVVGGLIPWMRFAHAPRVLHITLATATWGALIVLTLLAARMRRGSAEQGSESKASSPDDTPATASGGLSALVADLFWLTKPRVMLLLLVTAFGGMVLAAQGLPTLAVGVSVLLGGSLAAGGAGSINQGLEGPLDAAMLRTRHRPVAGGRISLRQAIAYGILLNFLAFVVLTIGANVLAALLAIGGSVFYVFVYTLWLKRTTVQNIVIGGAAGAVPPLVGWAGVTGGLDLPALYLFAIIFFWTPPHFWALALLIKDDYARAHVPMMPVVEGEGRTRSAIFLYTILVNVLAILFYLSTQSLGAIYLGSALVLGGLFIYYAVRLMRDKHRAAALRLYKFSLLYLALFFVVVMVDGAL